MADEEIDPEQFNRGAQRCTRLLSEAQDCMSVLVRKGHEGLAGRLSGQSSDEQGRESEGMVHDTASAWCQCSQSVCQVKDI